MGTDPLSDCPGDCSTTRLDDAWPVDVTMDCVISLADVLNFSGSLRCQVGDPCYWARLDFNADGAINVLDVMMLRPFVGTCCTP